MELNKLSKQELIDLKGSIDLELHKIETRNAKIILNKGSLLGLTGGDKIFGIRLSFGGHRLVDPEELNGVVDIIDYCDIDNNDLRGSNSKDFRLSISRQGGGFGISTTLNKEEYATEHCLLNMDTGKSGYDGFYTLKPESWKEDLKRAYQKKLTSIEMYHKKELSIYEAKLNMFLESEDTINQYTIGDNISTN